MAKFRFHKLAALAVLVAASTWVYTGDFTFVGSASGERSDDADKAEVEPAEPEVALQTVAVVVPPHIQHARSIRISGHTEPDKRTELAMREGGIVEKLPFEQGDPVKAGDLILELEAEEKNAMIETARRLVEQREAEFNATEALVERGTLPRLRADEARSAIAAARSQLEAAQAELARIKVEAPFDGILDRINVEIGSSVSQGAKIATLVNLDPLLGVGEISEHDLQHVDIGDEAEVRLVDGTVLHGKLRYISREATAQTRTFPMEVAIPNPDARFPAGMTAEITLRSDPVSAVLLPRSVVTLSADGDLGIRILNEEDKVVFVPIDLIDDTPRGLILGGIPENARIIVAGQDLVSEGDQVNAVEADAETIQRLIGEAVGAVN